MFIEMQRLIRVESASLIRAESPRAARKAEQPRRTPGSCLQHSEVTLHAGCVTQ